MVVKVIRAGHIVAYQNGTHTHLRDGVIVVEDDRIAHVGKTFDGDADEVIDASDKIVTPGFINTHVHMSESPLDRSFVEDRGPRNFYLSGLFEFLTARDGAISDQARPTTVVKSSHKGRRKWWLAIHNRRPVKYWPVNCRSSKQVRRKGDRAFGR